MKKILLIISMFALIIIIAISLTSKKEKSTTEATISFTDTAEVAGVDTPHLSLIVKEFPMLLKRKDGYRTNIAAFIRIHAGSAWGDYDNDGCLDLYVTNSSGENALYKNNCNGEFNNVAKKAGVHYSGRSSGVAFGDIENDGCLDLYVTNHYEENILYRNNCNGTFTNITKSAGVGGGDTLSTSVAFADYDNDGLLDIYVSNFTNDEITYRTDDIEIRSEPNNLYHNNGDGTFTDEAVKANLAGVGYKISMVQAMRDGMKGIFYSTGLTYVSGWFDYNRDRCIDVLIANDAGLTSLYKNNCDGTFDDVTAKMGFENFYYGMGIAAADINDDGFLDIYLTNGPTDPLFISQNGTYNDESLERNIYREPIGIETDDTPSTDYYNQIGWGADLSDYDNDGDNDLFVANGAFYFEHGDGSNNRIYQNEDGKFYEITDTISMINIHRSTGVASADYDNDGDIDLYVANTSVANNLYTNTTDNNNHWLTVRLEGTMSNRLGIGAEVQVHIDDKKWVDQVTGGMSYLSQSDYALHFGLENYDSIDEIIIYWPSGTVQKLNSIAVDQSITIVEE